MSDDINAHAQNIDPLTAPTWQVNEGEVVLLDPEVAPEPTSTEKSEWVNTTAPTPPNVDQILRGEYTGWVPIIKAGESLQDAEVRAEERLNRIEAEIKFEESVVSDSIDDVESRQLPSEILDSLPELDEAPVEVPNRKVSAWTDFVEDPDTAKSPAQALEEARARIQAMRDSLQYNMHQVSKSFGHPIFNDVQAQAPVVEPAVVLEPRDEVVETVADESAVTEQQVQVDDDVDINEAVISAAMSDETEIPQPTLTSDIFVAPTPAPEMPVVEPQQQTRPQPTVVIDAPTGQSEYVTSAPLGAAVAEAKAPDTSLELMIMRDEIKDLRTRLDASQKLIEDLMHRLTNLTELALKSRQN